eukprot:CAMPEP_0179185310 /NCGR_PEP_ID=MMETSP0796-20121207/91888_1 /TAXON_ID=73915 /ORGANISM="Pyrodinium bahamense, Strain pbaha01" /LENGTH=273 /DNA_ID=CAMNT_0020889265 /DNA_START=56 /DNA_END=876 /DNA_ORIENTATION=-
MGVTGAVRWHSLAALSCCLLAGIAQAEEKLGQIRGRVSIPQKFQPDLPRDGGIASMRVILDGGEQSALPTADGYFLISDVQPGPHLLQVVHPRLLFDPVRVEAQEGSTVKMTAYLADFEHGRGAKMKYPLGLAPSGTYAYLEKREEFNILSIFKSPMALISLFSFGAMLLLPKLQPMIEEEKERQRQEQEAKERESQAAEHAAEAKRCGSWRGSGDDAILAGAGAPCTRARPLGANERARRWSAGRAGGKREEAETAVACGDGLGEGERESLD